ncbi:MAG: leucine-rich repeat protein [Bacteroidales bacterium]|nr:leucine-rich repeat protein [Bacteroidales bacterium]
MNTRHIIHILVGIALSIVSSCVEEKMELSSDNQLITRLNAHMESRPDTKTYLEKKQGTYYPQWELSDSLAVFTEAGQTPAAFFLVDGAGTTEGLFEGPRSGDRYVALYPYEKDARWEGTQLSFTLPTQQNGSFPMLAISDNADLLFKNLCSVLKISLTGECVVGRITLYSDNLFLSGQASVDLSYSDAPQLVMQEGGSHYTTLDCGAVLLNKTEAKDFFIVVPAASYDGLTISVDTYTQTVTKSVSHDFTLKRSELRPITPFIVEAPMLDLDDIPDNQVWYKTSNAKIYTPDSWSNSFPFDVRIRSHSYEGDYGIIIFEAPLLSIKDNAFRSSSSGNGIITELHIPDAVERIGICALPRSIESFRIPGSLKQLGIGNIDDYGALDLRRIYGPLVASDDRSVVNNGLLLGVFQKGLEEYVTPPEVTTLSGSSIGYTNIKKLILSEGVQFITIELGYTVSLSAPNLEAIYLPESLQVLETPIVSSHGAPKLKGYYGNPRFVSEDNKCLIDPRGIKGPELISIIQNDNSEEYTIPEGIMNMTASFWGWTQLRRVNIPSSMDYMTNNLFDQCPNVEGLTGSLVTSDGRFVVKNGTLLYAFYDGIDELTFPSSARYIPSYRVNRTGIKQITVSEGTEELGDNSLASCNDLRSVFLPTTIKKIGREVFSMDDNLESIFLPCRIPPYVSGAPTNGHLPKLKVYVPEESISDYMNDPLWQNGWIDYLTPYHFDSIDPPAPYVSTDYSQDGLVTVLQSATEGKGIDLVFMGSSYSDRLIADGTYLSAMEEAMEAFFEPEPYRSFRNLFNVYVVNVVSEREDTGPDSKGLWVYLSSHADECFEYTQKAIAHERLNEATTVMVCKSKYQLPMGGYGLASTYYKNNLLPQTDYGSGLGLALLTSTELAKLVKHEAGGHAFAKLADEYDAYSAPATESEVDMGKVSHQRGENRNIDYTSNPADVLWAKFISDSRYEKEQIGVFEIGTNTGRYRPSRLSIMNDCFGGYNAPSREAIYYRIHKLAYGPEWEYNYEDFVKWDQGAKNIHPTATMQSVSGKKTYEVREPLPSKPFNPDEWTVTVMK